MVMTVVVTVMMHTGSVRRNHGTGKDRQRKNCKQQIADLHMYSPSVHRF
jgi:hypothetical protein